MIRCIVCGGRDFNDWPVRRFPANWSLGRRAGPLRNGQMVAYATHLIAFPGGRGTADCVRQAKEAGLVVRIVRL